ncbi:hypothetical protein BDF22DRAFT_775692 [Syncephalis plumigaleata]|nr:hypothetical protein BDF22DRAFT_775692 [Syncephalis plumigaleata]
MAAQPNLPSSILPRCGFDTITRSALELLKQLVSVYWKEFLRQVARDAELAGRPRPNLNDIRWSLEKSGLIQSVTGDTILSTSTNGQEALNKEASLDVNTKAINSTESATTATAESLKQELVNRRDTRRWNELTIGKKRMPSTRDATSTNLQDIAGILGTLEQSTTKEDQPAYILSHMPPLPPKYTFRHTLHVTYGECDQSRMVEESLKKLMATASSNSSTDADVKSSKLKRSNRGSMVNWPLVNCELASNRANLTDVDDVASLTSTLVSQPNHWSAMRIHYLFLPLQYWHGLQWIAVVTTTTTTTTTTLLYFVQIIQNSL